MIDIEKFNKDRFNILTSGMFEMKFSPVVYTPTDFSGTYINRSFCKKLNENDIVEIDPDLPNNYTLYKAVTMQWMVRGVSSEVSNFNSGQIKIASYTIPELIDYIKNPLEFYQGLN